MNQSPILILTRQGENAERFARAVQDRLGRALPVIHAPALDIVPLDVPQVPEARELIFSSAQGVAQAVRLGLAPVRAWCVGDKTAALAEEAGFRAVSAGGAADDLVALILSARPAGKLLHVAGRHTRGDIAKRLNAAGLSCAVLETYDQIVLAPPASLQQAAQGTAALVIPLFSPRSAGILDRLQGPAPRHVVAISGAVRAQGRITVSATPTEAGMIDATVAVILDVWPGGL